MRFYLTLNFILLLLGVTARLYMLSVGKYPRVRPPVTSQEEVIATVVGIALAIWAAWLLWMRP